MEKLLKEYQKTYFKSLINETIDDIQYKIDSQKFNKMQNYNDWVNCFANAKNEYNGFYRNVGLSKLINMYLKFDHISRQFKSLVVSNK